MDDRVNLVVVECGETLGRTHRVLWELATRLPSSRFDVGVWISSAPELDELADALSGAGITAERLPELGSRWDLRGALRIWLKLRRVRPRLLHLHHRSTPRGRGDLLLAEMGAGSRLVITDHSPYESASAADRMLKRRMLECADAVTVASGAAAENLICHDGAARERVRVVPHGIDLPDQHREGEAARGVREALGAGALNPLWITPAPLEVDQGHAVLLEALAELERRGIPFVAGFAGEGSQRQSLERRAHELKIAPRLRILGPVREGGPLLAAADAVVFPTLSGVAPAALPAALVRGRPVVASEVAGVAELLEPSGGRGVAPGNARMLVEALEGFYRRPDAARRLGMNAARRIQEQFSWSSVVEAYETIYDEVLGLASFVPQRGQELKGAY